MHLSKDKSFLEKKPLIYSFSDWPYGAEFSLISSYPQTWVTTTPKISVIWMAWRFKKEERWILVFQKYILKYSYLFMMKLSLNDMMTGIHFQIIWGRWERMCGQRWKWTGHELVTVEAVWWIHGGSLHYFLHFV